MASARSSRPSLIAKNSIVEPTDLEADAHPYRGAASALIAPGCAPCTHRARWRPPPHRRAEFLAFRDVQAHFRRSSDLPLYIWKRKF